jgi:hypothetical protein
MTRLDKRTLPVDERFSSGNLGVSPNIDERQLSHRTGLNGEVEMMGPIGDGSELVEKIHRLEEELRGITLRLDKSERGNRRMRLAGAGVFIATILLFAGGAALLGDRVARLDVVGPNNDIRASISVDPNSGSAGLEILGLNGRRVIFLGTSQDGIPNLAIFDPTGQRIVREVAP